MTTSDQTQNPEENPRTEEPRSSETTETTPNHHRPDSGWRAAALTVDHALRTAVDRARPAAVRVTEPLVAALRTWLAPLLAKIREWAEPRTRQLWSKVAPTSETEHRSVLVSSDTEPRRRPSRIQAIQGGLAMAVLGVVGVLIGGISVPQEPSVQDAALATAPTPEQVQPRQAEPRQAEPKQDSAVAPREQQTFTPKPMSLAEQNQAAMDIPDNASGIDVSNHNGSIDWNQVAAAGHKFAFVLGTDGDSFTNPMFTEQYQGAKDAGLMTTAYHFARPTGSATGQADRLVATMGGYQYDGKTLPPVLDLEVDPNSGGCYDKSVDQMHQWTHEFTDRVKETTGQDPIIYASQSFWQSCMGNSDAFSDHPLWVANYEVDSPSLPTGWSDYDFWQFTDSGSVPGISGPVDLNQFGGSANELKELAR